MRNALRFFRTCGPSLALMAGALAANPAAADSWRWDLEGGFASDYAYRDVDLTFASYSLRLPPAPFGTLSIGRMVTSSLSLRADVGYALYQESVGLMSILDERLTLARLRAHVLPIGVGVRLEAEPPRSAFMPFVQVSPTLFVVRLVERRVTLAGRDFHTGEYLPEEVRQESAVRVAPGFIAAAGWRTRPLGPISLTSSLRYLLSADLGRQDVGMSSGRFEGLNQLSYSAGISVAR